LIGGEKKQENKSGDAQRRPERSIRGKEIEKAQKKKMSINRKRGGKADLQIVPEKKKGAGESTGERTMGKKIRKDCTVFQDEMIYL